MEGGDGPPPYALWDQPCGWGMLEGLLLALPGLSASHFNLAPFSPQCRSPKLLMPHWRSRPALRSCVIPVGMCARERCCVCRTSTSTSGALCAKVSVYLALCLATKCPEPGLPARVPRAKLPRCPSHSFSIQKAPWTR